MTYLENKLLRLRHGYELRLLVPLGGEGKRRGRLLLPFEPAQRSQFDAAQDGQPFLARLTWIWPWLKSMASQR
jgi:hypothetical protein